MKKTSLSILIGFSVSLLTLALITFFYPNFDDFMMENPYWNGLSKFYRLMEPLRISNIQDLEPYGRGSTLFIIGPDEDFKDDECLEIYRFLINGGRVVLSDDFGTGNQLLAFLDLNIRFSGKLVQDVVFMEKNPVLPRVNAEYYDIGYLVLNYATYLEGEIVPPHGNIVVETSDLSYAVNNFNDIASPFRSLPIVAVVPVNRGQLILISDSSLFINSMIDKGGNEAFLNKFSKSTVIIDEIHRTRSLMMFFKASLAKAYTLLGFYEIRYSLILILIFGLLRINVSESEYIEPVEALMRQYPYYNREKLNWLEEERRKAREEQ